MNKWVMAACCAIGLASMSAGAEIYKWKDASGKMHYSDTPPTSRVPFTTLSGKKPAALPDSSAPAPSADKSAKPIDGAPSVAQPVPTKPAEAKPKEGAPSVDPKDAEAQKKAQEEKAAKEAELKRLQEEKLAAEKQIKEQNCRNARARAATYQQGGRIYTVDPNGERHYVGDQEMQEQLEQARADIESNCNN